MKNKQMIIFIMFILIIIFPNISLGTTLETNVSKGYINSDEEIKIKVVVKDIDVKNGINSIQGKLVYNKNDWDKVTAKDLQGKNNWSISYNENGENEGNFIVIKLDSGEIENQEIFEITLKSKNKIRESQSEIKLIDLYTTDGEKMISINNSSQIFNIRPNVSLTIGIIVVLFCVVIFCLFLTVIIKKRVKTNER